MAKNKCAVCGAKVKSGALRCGSCGIPQVDLNGIAKKKIIDSKNSKKRVSSGSLLDDRTLNITERLELFAKLIKVLAFFGVIAFAIYSIFSGKWLLLVLCVVLYFVVPFVALPISWMQLMLENLYEIKNKLK